ncbi:EI24 domain-containing protein [Erythrobacter sp. WG]|uniref:EI24 domain-containing protein n=1 Tax=Erythrobacter sp. WG TaxID=2985510 RepID=UPI002270A132|nr:EI24 domain-containing protein [Erythrobacter sp. WG]MCX9147548.1 EI24 domain-containing protein [Erythrobacter sp. WG]
MPAVLAALLKACRQLGDRAFVAVAVKSVAITLMIFALAGAGLYAGLAWLFRSAWLAAILPQDYAETAAVLVWLVTAVVAFWLLFRVVAVAVMQFFADAVVVAVEARHYPGAAARARPLPLRREIANAARGVLRAIGYNLLALPVAALLAFTAIGPALVLLAVNAVLLGRELTDMAWLRHCAGAEDANPVPRGERALLGAAIAGLMLVPLANLAAPLIGAAAGTHLVLRRLEGRTQA